MKSFDAKICIWTKTKTKIKMELSYPHSCSLALLLNKTFFTQDCV